MADENPLQDLIDEVDSLESDRPSVEVFINKSIRPKLPDSILARVIAVIVALGAIAELVHEVIR